MPSLNSQPLANVKCAVFGLVTVAIIFGLLEVADAIKEKWLNRLCFD